MPDLARRLSRMNNAQRGSFGEFLFCRVAREKLRARVNATRRDRADFVVDGVPIDVKTTIKDLNRALRPLREYRGPRIAGTSYAQVEFGTEGARVSLEANRLSTVAWPELAATWRAWGKARPPKHRPGNIVRLRKRVAPRFRELGFRARVIYRTTQAQFGEESPANLVPSRPKQDRLTVYLDFANPRLTADNIRRIIAFPDAAVNSLPLLERTRLHLPKVNLSSVPGRFVFTSLSELLAHAKRLTESIEDQPSAPD